MMERIGQQLGNYRLIRLLGSGGSADVYLGEHVHLGTQAAIKVLHSGSMIHNMQESFIKEARIIAPLTHPNIVRLLEFGFAGQTPYLVMDYAPGGSLRQKYPRDGTLPNPREMLNYTRQVASALQYAHDESIIHRDVKPENMLFGRDGRVLLSDFGIARAQSAHTLTGTGMIGTPDYIAPEQLEKNKPHLASDQYALGIVVYEWLAGRVPFQGSTVMEVAFQHLSATPPPLREFVRDVPDDVEKVIFKTLAKDPGQRYHSVTDFAEALEKAMHADYAWFTSQRAAPMSRSSETGHLTTLTVSELLPAQTNPTLELPSQPETSAYSPTIMNPFQPPTISPWEWSQQQQDGWNTQGPAQTQNPWLQQSGQQGWSEQTGQSAWSPPTQPLSPWEQPWVMPPPKPPSPWWRRLALALRRRFVRRHAASRTSPDKAAITPYVPPVEKFDIDQIENKKNFSWSRSTYPDVLSLPPGEEAIASSRVEQPEEILDASTPTLDSDATDVRQHVRELMISQQAQKLLEEQNLLDNRQAGTPQLASLHVQTPIEEPEVVDATQTAFAPALPGNDISYESLVAPAEQTRAFTHLSSRVKADFFISYTKVDSLYAHQVAHYLRQAGYSVHLPPVDFREGFIFRNEMRKAFGRGRQMITILSPAYFDALKSRSGGWGSFKRAAKEQAGTFFPLVVSTHEEMRQNLFGLGNYVDLVDVSPESLHALLLAYVTSSSVEPLLAPLVMQATPAPLIPTPPPAPPVAPTFQQQEHTGELTVFFSYSHKDEKLRKQLEKHLSGLRQKHAINGWHYGKINPGSDWKTEIDTHLGQANIVLLLVSADFINSEYAYKEEMLRAMERHEAGTARVIPIIMRAVHWQHQPFSKLQVLPEGAKAVMSWKDQDEAFMNVAMGIERIVNDLLTRQVVGDMATVEQRMPPPGDIP